MKLNASSLSPGNSVDQPKIDLVVADQEIGNPISRGVPRRVLNGRVDEGIVAVAAHFRRSAPSPTVTTRHRRRRAPTDQIVGVVTWSRIRPGGCTARQDDVFELLCLRARNSTSVRTVSFPSPASSWTSSNWRVHREFHRRRHRRSAMSSPRPPASDVVAVATAVERRRVPPPPTSVLLSASLPMIVSPRPRPNLHSSIVVPLIVPGKPRAYADGTDNTCRNRQPSDATRAEAEQVDQRLILVGDADPEIGDGEHRNDMLGEQEHAHLPRIDGHSSSRSNTVSLLFGAACGGSCRDCLGRRTHRRRLVRRAHLVERRVGHQHDHLGAASGRPAVLGLSQCDLLHHLELSLGASPPPSAPVNSEISTYRRRPRACYPCSGAVVRAASVR